MCRCPGRAALPLVRVHDRRTSRPGSGRGGQRLALLGGARDSRRGGVGGRGRRRGARHRRGLGGRRDAWRRDCTRGRHPDPDRLAHVGGDGHVGVLVRRSDRRAGAGGGAALPLVRERDRWAARPGSGRRGQGLTHLRRSGDHGRRRVLRRAGSARRQDELRLIRRCLAARVEDGVRARALELEAVGVVAGDDGANVELDPDAGRGAGGLAVERRAGRRRGVRPRRVRSRSRSRPARCRRLRYRGSHR